MSAGSNSGLAAAAHLLGRLLVRELDADAIATLNEPVVRDALRRVGIEPPERDDVDALAHRYCTLFVHPDGSFPPVQSLWDEGRYDGDAGLGVRAIAAASARELAAGARGAAPDHLGCILILWSELALERPELAERLARRHLTWGARALAAAAGTDGFYGAVAAATLRLLDELVPAAE